jgi:NAD(P)-dependent dehydrogenase (short-subunit alcohol dehydrogenase family)
MAMASPFSLDGRTALVTGANTGIGQGIALALAEAGATVVAAGRSHGRDRETDRRGQAAPASRSAGPISSRTGSQRG